jgi:hypothetical protein
MRRADNDNMEAVLKFYLALANIGAQALNLGIGHWVQSKA